MFVIFTCFTGFWRFLSSKYARFWIWHSCECAKVTQSLEYVWIRLSLPENCLNIPQYTLMSLNMSEHRWILPKCPWIFLKMLPADLVTFAEEILNGKPHVFMRCCKYGRVAKMQQLRTVLNILKCAWIIMSSPQYIWILLKKTDFWI